MRLQKSGPHRRRRIATAVLGVVAAAATAAACGDDDGGDGDDAAPPATEEAPASEPSAPADAEGDAAEDADDGAAGGSAEEAVEPGTEASVGDRVVVNYEQGDKVGVIAVTIDAIEAGEESDLVDAVGSDGEGYTPQFVRHTIENVSGDELARTSLTALYLVDEEGEDLSGARVSGSVGDCEIGTPGDEFNEAGATFETCSVKATESGTEPAGVAYKNEEYREDPVVWFN